jgi:hypothetical protein
VLRHFIYICLALLCTGPAVLADPGPGDIFREYTWSPNMSGGGWRRVTDPNSSNYSANIGGTIDIDDLQGAVRAEIYLEFWGGHAGTTDKRLRVNLHDWLEVPTPPAIPGDSGRSGQPAQPECYQHFSYAAIPVPLEQLQEGRNAFGFTSGGQTCFNFGWGQWGVYGVTFRIYYNADKAHPSGAILSPTTATAIGDSVRLEATASSPNGAIEQVDFIGYYEDFDYEGNGVFRQWHYNYRYGAIKRHLGTAHSSPYAVIWNTSWVPDQDEPMKLMARITDAAGISYMTPVVDDISLERTDRSVELYRAYDVPGNWMTRLGNTHTCKVFVPRDLQRANAARMVLTTWNGDHATSIGINDAEVVEYVGRNHNYGYDEVSVPLELIRSGTNTLFTFSSTEAHGIEVLWPGIALLVQYEGVESTPPPTADLPIFDDALASDWRLLNRGATDKLYEADAAPTATTSAWQGDMTLALDVRANLWKLDFTRDVPLDISGYTALHLAFRPRNVIRPIQDSFTLLVNGQRFSLLQDDGLTLDLEQWQIAEIPLEAFEFKFPYIESLALSGNFKGEFDFDDIRLVAAPPDPIATAVQAPLVARPRDFLLMQNFPNPFNSGTTLRFALPTADHVELAIYNLLGQNVITLIDDRYTAGVHTVHWDGRDASGQNIASGAYLYRLRVGSQTQTRRLVLLR